MTEGASKSVEPSYGFNMHYGKDDLVRITVEIPGLEATVTGVKSGAHGFERKVKPDSCKLDVQFADKRVVLDARILSGTHTGTHYHLELDEDDCRVAIKDQPFSSYDVKDGKVRIYLRRS
ncbi:uncharacterized protein LOC141907385 [Tubulanus polymorphus]|uniref:uncharacterized protein LOC141907385 n=1 Tax=Tubulanus polymorphus TaxID=672921 RepID=UPI003DA2CBD1